MESSDAPITQSKKNVSAFFVWLFAFVGFLAAVVQIAGVFSGSKGQLQVKVTVHEAVVPQMMSDAVDDTGIRPGFAARIAADEKKFFCNAARDLAVKDRTAAKERCEDYEGLDALQEMIRLNAGQNKHIDYTIRNAGADVARQIRLTGERVNLVEVIQKGAKTHQIKQTETNGSFSLPDLNPGEEITARVWSTAFNIDPTSEYLDPDDLPQLTFAGGKPSISLYRLAPDSYADIFDTLNDFWMPISVLIVLLICTAVGMAVILIISVVSALLSGQPLRKIFEKPESTPES